MALPGLQWRETLIRTTSLKIYFHVKIHCHRFLQCLSRPREHCSNDHRSIVPMTTGPLLQWPQDHCSNDHCKPNLFSKAKPLLIYSLWLLSFGFNYFIQCNINLVTHALHNTYFWSAQWNKDISRLEEASFPLKMKESISWWVAKMRRKRVPDGGTGECQWTPAKDETCTSNNMRSIHFALITAMVMVALLITVQAAYSQEFTKTISSIDLITAIPEET